MISQGTRTAYQCPLPIPPMNPKRPLLLRDMRNPSAPMQSMSLKLPAQMIAELDRHAADYSTSRMILVRSLLAESLEQLTSR